MRKYTKRQAKIMYELLYKAIRNDFKIFWLGVTENSLNTIELRSKKSDGTGWKYEDGYNGWETFKEDWNNYCKKRLDIELC